ncbi:MAG: ATP-binding protein [Planctomycetaceae bacterium]|nr:ATP-binding protein [Planctomycetaceae bacterium]
MDDMTVQPQFAAAMPFRRSDSGRWCDAAVIIAGTGCLTQCAAQYLFAADFTAIETALPAVLTALLSTPLFVWRLLRPPRRTPPAAAHAPVASPDRDATLARRSLRLRSTAAPWNHFLVVVAVAFAFAGWTAVNSPADGDGPVLALAGAVLLLFPLLLRAQALRGARQLREEHRTVAAALQRYERVAQAILEHSGLCIVQLDADGIVLGANRLALLCAGVPEAEVVGRHVSAIHRWLNPAAEEQIREMVRQTPSETLTRFRLEPAIEPGLPPSIEYALTTIRDDGEQVAWLIWDGRDHTQQDGTGLQFYDAGPFLRGVIDSLDSHTVVLDSAGRIASVNRAWREFALANGGGGCSMLEGANYLQTCDRAGAHCADARKVADAIRAVLAGAEAAEPIEYPCHSPSEQRWFYCSVRGFSSATQRYAVVSHLNVTAVKQAEAALSAKNRELSEAHRMAEAADRAKSEFLANMSHEIRTPLTAILGFADLLRDDEAFSGSPARRVDAVQTIQGNGEHLLRLINDILDLSKVEAGKLTVESLECSPAALVAEIVSLMRVRTDAKGIGLEAEYETPLPTKIHTDPTRLRQILVNLVGNAVKFTAVGSVRIVARCVSGASPQLEFDVVDTGVGMTEEQCRNLFQPFVQADASTTRNFGGTGLGLTISKRLAERLGGDVVLVESTPGRGTRLRVTIAAGSLEGAEMESPPSGDASGVKPPSAAVAHAFKATADGALSGRRLLLAEDGPDNQRLISFVLKRAGAEVTVVENGQLAVEAAQSEESAGRPFDVVLMDMQMPVLDGYGAVTLLRAEGYRGVVLALTAHAMSGDREKCLQAGCDDYATKPIDRSRLIQQIAGHAPRVTREAAVTGC